MERITITSGGNCLYFGELEDGDVLVYPKMRNDILIKTEPVSIGLFPTNAVSLYTGRHHHITNSSVVKKIKNMALEVG